MANKSRPIDPSNHADVVSCIFLGVASVAASGLIKVESLGYYQGLATSTDVGTVQALRLTQYALREKGGAWLLASNGDEIDAVVALAKIMADGTAYVSNIADQVRKMFNFP